MTPLMKRLLSRTWQLTWQLAWLVVIATSAFSHAALAQRAKYEALITTHAKANLVPEDLVHRVIVRESKYQASLLGSGGAIGLMQIKLATARGLGYTGTAEGLRDPATNLLYGIKYLAGAFRAANGDHDRAVHYYAAGYYFAAKQQRLDHLKQAKAGPSTAPPHVVPADAVAAVKDDSSAKDGAKDGAETKSAAKSEPAPAPQAGDSGVKAR
jgi:soluble lytic murein transglycosylase-like protein